MCALSKNTIKNNILKLDIERVAKLYCNEGYTVHDIAVKMGVQDYNIAYFLGKHGVTKNGRDKAIQERSGGTVSAVHDTKKVTIDDLIIMIKKGV